MRDDTGRGLLILAVLLFWIALWTGYDMGYYRGRRDAECRAGFALATTASDSLTVSRGDKRCAAMLTDILGRPS